VPGSGGPALTTETSRAGQEVHVALRGELDLATARVLHACLAPIVQEQPAPARVVLDVSALSFVDASGISALLTAQRGLAARGGQVVLRKPSRLVRRVLKVLDLEQSLPVEG